MTFMGTALSASLAAAAGLDVRDIVGLNNRFGVTIDGMDLGKWGQCDGLSVDFKPDPVLQGGVYDYQAWLPAQMSYTAIKLTRAVNASDSAKVQSWLAHMVQSWVYASGSGTGGTGVITLFSSQAEPVISWTLRNVFPTKWDGPKLDATTAGVAMESLSLVHEGFL